MYLWYARRKPHFLLYSSWEIENCFDYSTRRNKLKKTITGILIFAFLITSCGFENDKKVEKPNVEKLMSESDTTTLILATFNEDNDMLKQVELFNQTNEDYQIELKVYERSSDPAEDGLLKIQREIVSGNGPDMIDFGYSYSTSDVVAEYTEDLYPYLLEEPDFNQEAYFMNIFEAFTYKNNLYAMPTSFVLETFVGKKEVLENLDHWNINQMMTLYEKQEEGMLLYPGETKMDVFAKILSGNIDSFINWETGVCSFDSEAFQKLLTFCNLFPDKLNIDNDFSVKQTFLDGKALICPAGLSEVYDICHYEALFDESEISYIGLPTEGDSGTVITSGNHMLAISMGSNHKEVSWAFVYSFLKKDYQQNLSHGFPLSREVVEEQLADNLEPEYIVSSDGSQKKIVKNQILFDGDLAIDLYNITQEQADKLLSIIENAAITSSPDYILYYPLCEEAAAYFAGGKTVEEVVAIIQNRATIYVNEKVN